MYMFLAICERQRLEHIRSLSGMAAAATIVKAIVVRVKADDFELVFKQPGRSWVGQLLWTKGIVMFSMTNLPKEVIWSLCWSISGNLSVRDTGQVREPVEVTTITEDPLWIGGFSFWIV